MAKFSYTARNQDGAVQTGLLEAHNPDEAVGILQQRGLLVTSIAEKGIANAARLGEVQSAASRRMHGRVTTEDQVLVCQQLATLVDAGIPLLRSLKVVIAQVESRALLLALEEVARDVEGGRTFRDALARYPRVFSNMWVNLVETGEASGHLGQSLQHLAHHFEAANRLKHETMTALTYPAFLMVGAVGVLAVFIYLILPRFKRVFISMHISMPPLTKFVMGVSDGARQYWVAIVLMVGLLGYFIHSYLRTEGGQWMRDYLVLKLPLFRQLFHNVQIAEFSRGLSTLLESGVPLLSGLEILENSASNKVYGKAIGSVKEYVKEGKTMAEPMEGTGLFPPMAVQMIRVGEEVGELGKMVSCVARYYEERIERFIARMTRLFEPIAIVLMAGLVLVIVLSVFLPIFQMSGGGNIK